MKALLRVFATVHGLMAFLFACAALLLIVIAARIGWTVFAAGLDRAAAQGIIEAVGLLAAAVVALQIAQTITSRLLAHVASAVRIGFLTMAALAAGAGSAAEPALERGNWKLTVNSTINGKPEPVQNTEECLGDELNDLGAYFAPGLEGMKAKCKRARVPSKDPRKLNYRMQCSGAGFTMNTESFVTIEGPRHFTATMRMTTKTKKESAVVVANMEGRWTGACKPAAAGPASK